MKNIFVILWRLCLQLVGKYAYNLMICVAQTRIYLHWMANNPNMAKKINVFCSIYLTERSEWGKVANAVDSIGEGQEKIRHLGLHNHSEMQIAVNAVDAVRHIILHRCANFALCTSIDCTAEISYLLYTVQVYSVQCT